MSPEPIRVELTDFAKLGLLREEEERLGAELGDLERRIRERQLAAAEREFLKSLSAYYSRTAPEASAGPTPEQMEAQRALVFQALEVVRAQRQQYEEALSAPAADKGARSPARRSAGSAAGAAGKRSRFDSFDDFRQRQDQPPGSSPPQG